MQTTNAFNDNFAKFILMPLGVALYDQGEAFAGMEYLLGGLLVLPFILFAPAAGWLGDRFSKSSVIRWASWGQLGVLSLMVLGLWLASLEVVIFAFFLLATQSALLSPAKMGVVKELVGSEKLGFANGVMEGTVILGILLGQILGGVSFDVCGVGRDPWSAAMIPVMWVLLGAVLSIFLSHSIQRTVPQSKEKFSLPLALGHFKDLGRLIKNRPMWRCSLGIAFFWSFGAFLQFLLFQRSTEKMGPMEGLGLETALVWLPVVVGIVSGSVFASWMSRKRNELGLVVLGGLMMMGSMFLAGVVTWPEWFVRCLLALAGAGGALFLVPLNAYLQDEAEDNERGVVLSASNLLTNLGAVVAIALQFGLKAIGVPVWGQFLFAAVVCGWVTIYILRLLPQDFIRMVFLGLFRRIYKIRAVGVKNIPKTGGVLMVPNHMSYIDTFVLSAACPRPIRFVMFADCFDHRLVGKWASFFDAVPISPGKARDGIRIVTEALNEGTVVCVFAEGQLSRTGGLAEIKRGYQMMAKKAKCPVLPTYMDGLWGSMWSFSEGNFLKKRPKTLRYGVTVGFAEPLEWNGDVSAALRDLSVETVAVRELALRSRRKKQPDVLGDWPRGWTQMLNRCWADDEAAVTMRKNALQLGQVNMAHRNSRLFVEWIPEDELSGVLGVLWPLAVDAKVFVSERLSDTALLAKVDSEELTAVALRGVEGRESLVDDLAARGVVVWSFDEKGLSDGKSFGCLVRDERVISYAFPDPIYKTTTEMAQSGWREGRRGKLLPGWSENEVGPLDEEGFLEV